MLNLAIFKEIYLLTAKVRMSNSYKVQVMNICSPYTENKKKAGLFQI